MYQSSAQWLRRLSDPPQVYELVEAEGGVSAGLQKVISSLGLPVPQKDLQHKDPRVVLQAVMGSWLPLAPAVLSMVVDHLPDPIQGQKDRISRFLPDFARYEKLAQNVAGHGHEGPGTSSDKTLAQGIGGLEMPGPGARDGQGHKERGHEHASGGEVLAGAATNGVADPSADSSQQQQGGTEAGREGPGLRDLQRVVRALRQCDAADDAPCVVFVSKMIAVPKSSLPREAQALLQAQAQAQGGSPWGTPGEDGDTGAGAGGAEGSEFGGQDCFLAFARIFSGRLRPGQRLCVLSSLYDPLNPDTFQRHRQVRAWV